MVPGLRLPPPPSPLFATPLALGDRAGDSGRCHDRYHLRPAGAGDPAVIGSEWCITPAAISQYLISVCKWGLFSNPERQQAALSGYLCLRRLTFS